MAFFQKTILIFALLVLTSAPLLAQNAIGRRYSMDDGLASNRIRGGCQDASGFMWFASFSGLHRFDGVTIKKYCYSSTDPGSISSNGVEALMISRSGKMWAGLDVGIDIYDPLTDSFSRFGTKDANGELFKSPVRKIMEDADGEVWIGTYYTGVYRYDALRGSLELFRPDMAALQQVIIIDITQDSSGRIWISTLGSGLFRYDKAEDKLVVYGTNADRKIPNDNISKVTEDSYGNIWVATYLDRRFYRYNDSTDDFTDFGHIEQDNKFYNIHDIIEYKPGELLVTSNNGVAVLMVEEEGRVSFSEKATDSYGLGAHSLVYWAIKDREGNMWFTTYHSGVEFRSTIQNRFVYLDTSQPGSEGARLGTIVHTIREDAEGHLWISTENGGVLFINKATQKLTVFREASETKMVNYDLLSENGNLWIASQNGIERVELTTGRSKVYLNHNIAVFQLMKSGSGRIYAATREGLWYYNREADSFVHTGIKGEVAWVVEDAERRVWASSSEQGLFCYNQRSGTYIVYKHDLAEPSSLIRNALSTMALDSKGRLWISSSSYGLCRFDNATSSFVRYENLNIPNNTFNAIVADGDYLWISTNKGIFCFDPDSGEVVTTYTSTKGIHNDQFTYGAGLKSSDGKLYFGSSDGICCFAPSQLDRDDSEPQVLITRLTIFDKEVDCRTKDSPLTKAIQYTDKIELKANQAMVGLEFSSMSFVSPQDNKYLFRLEGIDREWRTATGSNNRITYANIPPGDYHFQVKATNRDGVWSNHTTTLDIKVLPPFFKSYAAIVLYIILAAFVFVSLIIYLLKRNEKEQIRRIEILNAEKEKEIYNSKIAFFTNIAHEIRTPLSLIIGPLEYLMKSSNIAKKHGEYLTIIEKNYKRLYSLVNQLLDFRKMDSGSYKAVYSYCNVHGIVTNVVSLFEVSARHKHTTITVSVEPEDLELVSDEEALTKIVSNLLTNAIKNAQSSITVSAHALAESLLIEVSDDGKGVPQAEREKIFDAFYQPDGNASVNKMGVGIGLHMTRSLVTMLGGKVHVTEKPDGTPGALFRVELQKLPGEKFVIEKDIQKYFVDNTFDGQFVDQDDAPSTDSSKRNSVMIVDDNLEILDFLTKILSEEYFVMSSQSGEEALKILVTNLVDIIVSDIMMGDMDGLELCRIIKNDINICHIPVVLLTAKTDIATKISGLDCGADAYIEKPFSTTYLKAQLRNLLNSREELKQRFANSPLTEVKITSTNKYDEEFLEKVTEIISDNIADTAFTVDMLAKEMLVSRTSLFTKLKAITGLTPNDFIRVYRLKESCKLMAQGEYRTIEICFLVGFNSSSYFAKCFSKQFGMLPSDFIRMVKEQREANQKQ